MDFLFGDLDTLLKTVGLLGIFGIVFAESGLLIGIILPGDSLLVTAGFLASQEYFNILLLIIAAFAGAVLGDSFGYAFGKKVGPFLPVIRTFAPILAGVGKMRYGTFLFFNAAGGLLWAVGLPLAGFFLGKLIPGVERYIAYIIAGIVVATVFPPIIHVVSKKEARDKIISFIRKQLSKQQ
ncbi:MAG: putative membrane protein [Candidatus Giovannonibacteria bacterium GW2011_GWA2_45_21]|uniref:Putative membrane protein n=1 Tax=Candidatus Giovannonibacteria bacterium GW2011_GWA2_45_21 TaxID=1618649 RepID=A0A0G1Q5E9_9BACT|nr:MAG: putative membrane protein [Candidatus Giovannonibacteria bacterium GW2011_GWA2_45_21]